MARALALLALSSAAAVMAAQTTTVSVFMPLFDKQDIDVSIVAADSAKTTFFARCPASADSNECGVASTGQEFIYGPSTFALSYSYNDYNDESGIYTEDMGCKLDPKKDYATCSVTVSQSYDGTTNSSATAIATSGYLKYLIPVTVTAGAEKLNAKSASETSTAIPASTLVSSIATATQSDSTPSAAASSGSASGSSASATTTPVKSGNAAGPAVTQNAVLAGAAVLVGGAMLL